MQFRVITTTSQVIAEESANLQLLQSTIFGLLFCLNTSPNLNLFYFLLDRQALNILCSLDWNVDGKMSFSCLSTIINHLMKLPLNSVREGTYDSDIDLFNDDLFFITDGRCPKKNMSQYIFCCSLVEH